MAKTIGIDLGTTNSCVGVIEGGEPAVIPNAEGGRTTPSVVAFTNDGQRLVGAPAKRQQVTNPQNTIFSIKRFMGRKSDEVSEEMTMIPYEVTKGDNGDARVEADGKQFAPPEISAMILQKLKADAEAYLGEAVTDAASTFAVQQGNQLASNVAKSLGLKEARIQSGGTFEQTELFLGTQLTKKLYLGYGLGLFENLNVFRMRYLLNSSFTLEAETAKEARASVLFTREH